MIKADTGASEEIQTINYILEYFYNETANLQNASSLLSSYEVLVYH